MPIFEEFKEWYKKYIKQIMLMAIMSTIIMLSVAMVSTNRFCVTMMSTNRLLCGNEVYKQATVWPWCLQTGYFVAMVSTNRPLFGQGVCQGTFAGQETGQCNCIAYSM